jgi:hypothetical protein
VTRRSRVVPALAALLALAVAVAGPATARKRQASPLPHVTFAGFTIYSLGGGQAKVKPGKRITACHAPASILARGTVKGAIKHQKYLETWSRNGKKTDSFTISWAKKGKYADSWELTDRNGFRNGTWTITLTRGGKRIGRETVKLACV